MATVEIDPGLDPTPVNKYSHENRIQKEEKRPRP
jgi:hypothetical protein